MANEMHDCWRIPELAARVAEACAPGYRDVRVCPRGVFPASVPPDLRTVYALARTCRTLQEPALDVLWYRPKHGLWKLLTTLPHDLWVVDETPGGRHGCVYRQPKKTFVSFSMTLSGLIFDRWTSMVASQKRPQGRRLESLRLLRTPGARARIVCRILSFDGRTSIRCGDLRRFVFSQRVSFAAQHPEHTLVCR